MSLVSGPGRGGGGVSQPADEETTLCAELHVKYIQSLDTRKDELEYWKTEHLRLNGLYWGLTACFLLGQPEALPHEGVIDFISSCWNPENGGFGAAPGHDSHMLYTVSAVQLLTMVDTRAWDGFERRIEQRRKGGEKGRERVAQFIASLQDKETGTFAGDEWGETDTRFLYGALNALSLMGEIDLVNRELAISHIQACRNFDGGYGTSPGAESHSGQVFVCVGALTILKRTDLIDRDRLGAWLSERQLPSSGGLNGRPEKLPDVCYSWWVISSLKMIDRLHWIDGPALARFILLCQDTKHGGISDRPGDMVDVYHTVFGIAGLSLIGWPGCGEVDARYCMPMESTKRALGEGR